MIWYLEQSEFVNEKKVRKSFLHRFGRAATEQEYINYSNGLREVVSLKNSASYKVLSFSTYAIDELEGLPYYSDSELKELLTDSDWEHNQ